MKKVLVLCTGNSCRSIMAEALINYYLDGVVAYSSGVNASLKVNEKAKKVLKQNGIWDERYHSKTLDKVLDIEFDLVVTVCDNAKENCPIFPKKTKNLHISFKDPDGKDFKEFEKTYQNIKEKLLPKIKEVL
jgi:arsenate reductase